MTELGELIRDRRKVLRITQVELARSLGFSFVFLSNIERGRILLPVKYMKSISRVLEIPFGEVRGCMKIDIMKKVDSKI